MRRLRKFPDYGTVRYKGDSGKAKAPPSVVVFSRPARLTTMVIITFASIFFLLAALSSFSFPSPIKPRDFNQFQIDMRKLAVDVGNLTSAITTIGDGTGITLVQETAAYNQFQTVQGDLTICIKDVPSVLNITESEANTILQIIEDIVPGVLAALQELVAKKTVFASLYIPVPIIHTSLVALNGSVLELGAALIDLAPADLKATGQSIETKLGTAFNQAIVAYSSL